MSRDLDSLTDLLGAAQRRVLYVQGMDATAFAADVKTQDAVIRCLEVIGEATKRLSPELRAGNPHLPWHTMAGMRDVLIHAYDKVDITTLWETTHKSVPPLIPAIAALISRIEAEDTE